MIDALIKQMEQNRYESEKRFQQERADSRQDMLQTQKNFERQIRWNIHFTIGILGFLIIAMSTITILADYFIR
jgi:hypothetical protein